MRIAIIVASELTLAACGGGGNGVTGPPPPRPDAGPITLAVGEVRTIGAADAATLRITGAPGGADFTLIPFNGSLTPSSTVALEFSGTQLTSAVGPPQVQAGGVTAGLSVAPGAPRAAAPSRLEARLRRAEHSELGPRLAAARAAYAASQRSLASTAAAAVPPVGATMTFNASPTASCATRTMRAGRVVAVTQHAIVVADDGNPSGGFTDAEYASIGEEFDTHAYPLVTQTFGAPTDLDRNDRRVILFFSRAVNELTPSGSAGFVAGMFIARDLFRKSGAGACPASNEAEMFYVLVPDPDGEVNGNQRTKTLVRRIAGGVIAHEYQHLVNAARRMYVNNANGFEETWLNEGLSTIAEELMFYRVAGLSPRRNLAADVLLSPVSTAAAADAYQVGNFNRLIEYLRNPELESPFGDNDDLATRGATWQFLRYAVDRSATTEQTLWSKLVNAKTTGAANVSAAFGTDFLTLVRDWATAQYTDDAVAAAPPTFQQASWNYRSILPTLVTNRTFPLRTRSLAGGALVTLTLRGGGASYLRFGVASGATGTVQVTSSGGAVPGAVSLTIVRTR